MPDYILLMHDDVVAPETPEMWDHYLTTLRAAGVFEGGSSIGRGVALRNSAAAAPLSAQLVGFIRVTAPDDAAARRLVDGNPVYECGGTVEVRELPRD